MSKKIDSTSLKGKIKVGDTVEIDSRVPDWDAIKAQTGPRPGPTPRKTETSTAVVSRIGRKYAYVERGFVGSEEGFDMDTGRSKDFDHRTMTLPEVREAREVRKRNLLWLERDTRNYMWADQLTTEAIVAINEILAKKESYR